MEGENYGIRAKASFEDCRRDCSFCDWRGNRELACAERCGAEQVWAAEERNPRGGLQVEEHYVAIRQGAGAGGHQDHGREDSGSQKYLAEDTAQSDSRF